MSTYILISIMSLLVFFIFVLLIIPEYQINLIKKLSLIFSFIILFCSLFLWFLFNNEQNSFIFVYHLPWSLNWNIYYSLGLDGISIFFILLTTLLIPFCMLISWYSIKYKIKEFLIILLVIELLLINVFSVLDLFFFYIFFESVLIPMFFVIGIWGSRQRKIHAAYQFFFYTLLGSILMLLGIIYIYFQIGSTDIQLLNNAKFNSNVQVVLWICFFCSFSVKVPMLPFHIWLPEAHVEAPTAGSVILAGVLLKLGTYGILRFMIPLFPFANHFFLPLIFTLCLIAVIYSSCTTIRQIDLKKIIAYSSVAHMNFALLGLFVNNSLGLEGSLYLMLGHGIVSSALFLCIGILYDRYHTRNLLYYGGLVTIMPYFSIFFLIFILANIGMPGTINFIGEFLVLLGIFNFHHIVAILAGLSMVLGAIYSIWLYNRIIFGTLKSNSLLLFCDLSRREFMLLVPLVSFTLIFGLIPNSIISSLHVAVNNYILLV